MEFKNSKTIIVLGDIMLDIQIYGTTEKIANEAPIPVLHTKFQKSQLGGCGNVLMNLQSLGCKRLFIFSMIGIDSGGGEIQSILNRYEDITPVLCRSNSYTTTVKTRGFSNKKIIFRYDREDKQSLSDEDIHFSKSSFDKILLDNSIDAIILSDYNKGFLTGDLTQYVISKANVCSIPTFVDPKVDYRKYIGSTVFKPNIKEIQDIFGIPFSYEKIGNIHQTIQELVKCSETILTLSEKGISYSKKLGEIIHKRTETREVCDVTGAGDVVISLFAYFYNSMDISNLIQLVTWIGTESVKHLGTYVVTKRDVINAYKEIFDTKLLTPYDIKKLNSPFVITNGCFDIVHEGHIALFKYCKSLTPEDGYVVVALNSDDSIRRLKGSTRPINSLESRIALLNTIKLIDWIIVFEEDTPYELYKLIQPTRLVKGGDYSVEQIIGREFCQDVKIFNYIPDKSTTKIIKRIKENIYV